MTPLVLAPHHLSLIGWSAGYWLLEPVEVLPVEEAVHELHPVGIYVLTDRNNVVLHLGKVFRNDGFGGRIRQHLRHRVRSRTESVALARLNEATPQNAVHAIEGKAACELDLRRYLPYDRWPNFSNWAELAAPPLELAS